MFFEAIRSERLLMGHAADRLSVRWYVGYDLDESLPDHSSLSRIRERFGFAVEAQMSLLFSDQAEEETGEGEQAEQDASQVESASPQPSQPLEQASPMELPTALSAEQRSELSQQNAERHY